MSNQDDEIISSASTFPPLSIITNNIHHDDINNNNNNNSNNIISLNNNETTSTPLSLSPSSSISSINAFNTSSFHHPMHVLTFPRNSSQTLLDIHLHQYEQEQQEIKRIEIPTITIDNTSPHSAGGNNNNLEVENIGLQKRTSSTDSMSSSNSSLMNGPPPASSSLSSLEGIEDKQQQQGQFNNVNNNNNNLNINNNNNERSSITLKRQKGNDEKKTSLDRIVDDHHHGIEHHVDFHIDEDAHHHFENPLLMMSKMNSLPSIESNLSRVASSVPLNADYHSDMESVEEHKANHPAQFFDQQCFMEWKNITFPMGSPKPILKNINGFVAPGKLTAILGPIGSGKSTLLRILSGRGARIYSGDIHINGQLAMNSEKQFIRIDSGRFKSLVSFVAKDFTPSNMSLTVHEILQFAVRLKLPSKSQNPLWTTREDRLALLLSSYGLRGKENCLYSALSSGEKRRLTIAVQNVLFHRIVLLEYPTEFMEFGESFLLLKRMKRLADLGVSIIVCLHKPSVQEIEIFDNVSILNKGRQIYFGRPTEINSYFNSIGVRFPHERQNTIAGVLEILLLNDMYNSNNEDDKKYAIKHLTDTELKKIDSLDKEYEDRMQSFYIPQKHREELPFLQNTIESIQTEKYYANYWFSILILLQRIYTVKFRNWKTEILSPLLEKIIISVVIGILFLQIDATNMSMKGKIFSFLNLNISLTFGLGLKTLVGQIPNLMQERNSTSYRISAFFIAKSIEDTIDFTIYPTVFGIIAYFMCGLGLDPARIFSFILIFALFNLTSMSVAQALASLIPLPSFLNFISPVISLVFILLSSAYGITKTDYINWMGYFSYLYYAFRALAINEFSGVIIHVAPNQNGTIVIPAGQYTNGTLFLEKAYGITEPYYMMWVYTAILFLYFILCKILAYVGLRFVYGKKSPKRTLQNILSHFKSCCKK